MKTSSAREIQPPRLPKRFADGEPVVPRDDGEIVARELSGVRFAGHDAARLLFEAVHFRKAVLGPSHFRKPRFLDCRLDASDLSGADWEQARFRRVEFADCRAIGAQWVESEWEDVVFRECNLERSVLASAKFRAARFVRCSLREASLENADLSNVLFEDCDLTRADLRLAKLQGADLRGSTLDGLQAGYQEFRGAIVDSAQAVRIAELLEVVVREKGEDPSR